MMNQTASIALVLAIGTSAWTWWPKGEVKDVIETAQSQVLTASGQNVDANQVAAIRVVTLDDASKGPKPFEVRRTDGQWMIPSHFDYPADGGTMVGETAGAVLNLPMGPLVTADKKAHGEYGVLDPLDSSSGTGAGKRVTLSDAGGVVLIDVIIGRQKANTDVYFVRRANEDNIYTAKVQPNAIKATFKDWVETDLLKLAQNDIVEVTVKDYSVDEGTGTLQNRSTVVLSHPDGAENWRVNPPVPGKQLKSAAVKTLTEEAVKLRLVGVRPYANAWLQDRGFYVGQAQGGRQQLFGNEGELQLASKTGLVYHLFFGEIALGDEEDKAAKKAKTAEKAGGTHNRYMAIFVQYSPELDQTLPAPEFAAAMPAPNDKEGPAALAAPPPQGPPKNQEAINKAIADGQARAKKAQERFQKFFYVVSDDSFKKLRPARDAFYEASTEQAPGASMKDG
ncbi:MAG: DUF4340 domain-containing protein [Myxococcota bacterium]|nr:DUF4340 domain-containing protein [Myxococcota bacterium]